MGACLIRDLLLNPSMDDPAFLALAAVRLALAFAPVPGALKYDQQLSSPLTAYSRCAERVSSDQCGLLTHVL